MRPIILVLLVGSGLARAASAQEGPRAPGTFLSESRVRAELARSVPTLGIVAGQTAQIFEEDGSHVIVRRRQEGPNNASVHEDLTEIYYIVGGSGTFVTGGTIPDPENRTAGITGGVAQRVQPGDWIVLPPGTPHWFSQIDGSIAYVETRFAPAP